MIGGVWQVLAGAAERNWDDIPAVKLVGLVIGAVLIVAAIRAMFGKR